MMQLLILLLEAVLSGSMILVLFWLRRFIGVQALFVAVGALQYLQVVLAASIYVELIPGLWVSPGSAAIFPASIFAVLLIYLEDDALQTRALAYSLVISNVVLFAASTLAAQHLQVSASANVLGLPPELFHANSRIVIAGTAALFADIIVMILLYERLGVVLPGAPFVRAWITMTAVMALDTGIFVAGAFLGTRPLLPMIVSGFVGKAVVGSLYVALLAGYARLVEQPFSRHGDRLPLRDIFELLSYRQRYEEAQQRATRDALTGLFNRGYFDETLLKHVAQARRQKQTMTLVFIDADKLKTANDKYGHRMGDRLLQFIAQELHEFVRSSDTACRYGGDEFAVILATADVKAASIFSERLLERAHTKSLAADPPFPWGAVSMTIGFATYPQDATTAEGLIEVADTRLYEGKRAGGGCARGGTRPAEAVPPLATAS